MKVLLFVLLVGLGACATAPVEPPLNKNQCDALAHAAYKASSANDAGAAGIFMQMAKMGGCF
jgi:hypothetical protein